MVSVKDAKTFIDEARRNSGLRQRFNRAVLKEEIAAILADLGVSFTQPEFFEGYSYILANSPDAETTEELQEFNQWWMMLAQQ